MLTADMKALIVGGGIAGLASAIALQRVGVECDVAEIGDLRPIGAGIGLAGRAPDALDELGVYEQVAATGQPLGPPVLRDAVGAVITMPPPPPEVPEGKKPLGAYRPIVAEILAKAARRLGANIQTDSSIASIEEHDDRSLVTMSNGDLRAYDMILGADGVNSRTRSLIMPDTPQPAYAGQMTIRWMASHGPMEGEGWYIDGGLGRIGFLYQRGPKLMYVTTVINMPKERLTQPSAHRMLKRLMDEYTAPPIVELREQLERTPDAVLIVRPFEWILLDRPWYRGRTLLIGDAAHATTAHLGMGGVMALEDAVVLAQCIAAAPSLAAAYEAFMERRFERVRTVVETSITLCEREHETRFLGPEVDKLMDSAFAALSEPY